ncbi:hypothetical protein C5469_18210 [Photorhabdus cinerea]|uniref:Uncharacterized protein n=1 Tax=Photorhabdus cinerea TaxID=471575 RepID=A0A7X5QGJ3_9GAMM|nr:hypothetical protein [Photorhabdus cinerea]
MLAIEILQKDLLIGFTLALFVEKNNKKDHLTGLFNDQGVMPQNQHRSHQYSVLFIQNNVFGCDKNL